MTIESVSPEGLRERAQIMRERGDESCARHLELAADQLDRLRALDRLSDIVAHAKPTNPLNDPTRGITAYRTEIERETKEARIVFMHKPDGKTERVLGYLILTSEETYTFGSAMHSCYDKLEGLTK